MDIFIDTKNETASIIIFLWLHSQHFVIPSWNFQLVFPTQKLDLELFSSFFNLKFKVEVTTVAITSNDTTIDDGNVEVGFWILGGMLIYLVVILIFVLWCLNSRKGTTCCNCEVGRACQGQCECLEVRIISLENEPY